MSPRTPPADTAKGQPKAGGKPQQAARSRGLCPAVSVCTTNAQKMTALLPEELLKLTSSYS